MEGIELSVVIAAHDCATVIEACLEALASQCLAGAVEVIVADSSTDDTAAIVAGRFPWVRLLHFDQRLTVPALRGRGIAVTRGGVVAILDAYSVAAPDWSQRVLEAHARQPHIVIGGTVGLYRAEQASFANWILYLNEYGLFMPPNVRGETWIVPGSNVAYKRAALFDGAVPRYPVFWKTFVNWEIERAGSRLWLEPNIRVDLNKPIPLSDYLRTRYSHGRCFGGLRVEHEPAATRWWRAATTLLVPPLLTWRWTRGFWSKRRHRARFIASLPAQLVLFTVWAIGEASGYLRGCGKSCERLFY